MATHVDRARHLGALLASTAIMNGLSLQLKDIAADRDFRSMFDDDSILPGEIDHKFLLADFAQGGDSGIFADCIFSDVNRFGEGPSQILLGLKS